MKIIEHTNEHQQHSEVPIKWFDKEFDFNLGIEQFSNLLERLKKTSVHILEITNGISEQDLCCKPAGKWSIKDHTGHLWVLEKLWQKRFMEIKENKASMSPADLNNTETDSALFNQYDIKKLTTDFRQEREHSIKLLESFNKTDLSNSLNHPRLNQPMSVIDLMYFVAEHDEHHLNTILKIINNPFQV